MRYHAVPPAPAPFTRSRDIVHPWLRVAARTAVLYWCVLSLTFVLLRLAPGDPATFLLPPGAGAADAARMRAERGLDRPVVVQYARWLDGTLHGDLGTSFAERRPVRAVLAD